MTTNVIKPTPRVAVHRIADLRQSKPFWVLCMCGWTQQAVTLFDNEENWKRHKREQEPVR